MKMNGFIKLHRRYLVSKVRGLKGTAPQAFIGLLLLVDFETGKLETSVRELKKMLLMPSTETLYNALAALEQSKSISITRRPNLCIKVRNWKKYQAFGAEKYTAPKSAQRTKKRVGIVPKSGTALFRFLERAGSDWRNIKFRILEQNVPLNGTPIYISTREPYEEIKNSFKKKEKEKEVLQVKIKLDFINNNGMFAVFQRWLAFKGELKDQYKTQKGVEACYQRLVRLSGGSVDRASAIVNQSIENEWRGLFELKNERAGRFSKENFNKAGAGKYDD